MKAEIIINRNFVIGNIDKRTYGSFLEHIGRAIYEGIYEPNHKDADDLGFRKDVLELVKKLDIPVVRYPGGSFVSAYNWEDGIGERSKRPKKLDPAWCSVETNEIGIDEFCYWSKRAGCEVMMAVNLGTRGAVEAQNCVEYCNLDSDTYYANLRRENGNEKPHNIKLWYLGNEMGGLGQIGRKTADEYGRLALETAKHMRRADPSIELAVCGSSHINMPGFGDWDITVLDHTYDYIDYISIHQYYSNSCDSEDYLARAVDMDNYIKAVVAMCDAVKAKKRSNKTVNISFDEYNVWTDGVLADIPKWQTAPHIAEMVYTLEDALVLGSMLITLQNNCDRVKIACIAQLVNAIAPIMTEKDGKAWVQTIFYPFLYSSLNGRGTAMKPVVRCETYSTEKHKNIPYVECSVINNSEKREINVFAVNRSLKDDIELNMVFEDFGECNIVSHIELNNDDLKAVNTKETEAVVPKDCPVSDKGTVVLKKHSWNMIKYKY